MNGTNIDEIKIRFECELIKYMDYQRGKGIVIEEILNEELIPFGLNEYEWDIIEIDGDEKIIKKNTAIIEKILKAKLDTKKGYIVTFRRNENKSDREERKKRAIKRQTNMTQIRKNNMNNGALSNGQQLNGVNMVKSITNSDDDDYLIVNRKFTF